MRVWGKATSKWSFIECLKKFKWIMAECREEKVRQKINSAICVLFSVSFILTLVTFFYFSLVCLNNVRYTTWLHYQPEAVSSVSLDIQAGLRPSFMDPALSGPLGALKTSLWTQQLSDTDLCHFLTFLSKKNQTHSLSPEWFSGCEGSI